MTPDEQGMLLVGVLEAIAKLQAVADDNNSMLTEAHARLDRIDVVLAETKTSIPMLATIRDHLAKDTLEMQDSFAALGGITGFTLAAAAGNPSPLPTNLADHPVLERFILRQPADMTSDARVLVDWRSQVSGASTEDLNRLLSAQQEPSPTDTPDTRLLRYQLAAITRSELGKRGEVPAPPPASTVAKDRSAQARQSRSEQLGHLWRAGPSPALFGEAELTGSLDRFYAYQEPAGITPEQMRAELSTLHTDLANQLEAGERPFLGGVKDAVSADRDSEIRASRER